MTKTRARLVLILIVLVSALPARVGLATAAAADDETTRKEAAAAKRLEAASKIDALKVDDAKLEEAVAALDANISVQASATAAARQAANVAEEQLDAAQLRLQGTEKHIGELKTKAQEFAVQAYVNPGGLPLLEMVKSKDLAEMSRRKTLMNHVVSVDRDILGELRRARQDQQAEQANLLSLRDQTQEKRRIAAEKLATLEKARSDQVRFKSALEVRIREYTFEVEALAREEANIAALIRNRQLAGQSFGAPVVAAAAVSGAGLIWPANGNVASPFGMRWGRMHTGIDIDAGYGAAVRAAKGGTVITASYYGGYGLCVIIDHGGGLTTLYAHESSVTVGEGDYVNQGTLIGYVGATGNASGPHLHFETRSGGEPQNPLRYLP